MYSLIIFIIKKIYLEWKKILKNIIIDLNIFLFFKQLLNEYEILKL